MGIVARSLDMSLLKNKGRSERDLKVIKKIVQVMDTVAHCLDMSLFMN